VQPLPQPVNDDASGRLRYNDNMFMYLFYLTTTSGRPEPECTPRRVTSSEPIQDEQLTRDCKQTTNN